MLHAFTKAEFVHSVVRSDAVLHKLSISFVLYQTRRPGLNGKIKEPRRLWPQQQHKFAYLTMKNSSFARFAREKKYACRTCSTHL